MIDISLMSAVFGETGLRGVNFVQELLVWTGGWPLCTEKKSVTYCNCKVVLFRLCLLSWLANNSH